MKSRYEPYSFGASCRIATGSITMAQKARRALGSEGIRASVVKLPSNAGSGCIYGIEFPCANMGAVKSIVERI